MARDLLDRINDSTYGPAPVLLLIPTTRISFFLLLLGRNVSILTRRKLLFLKREGKTVKMSLAAYWQELPVCVYTNES